MASEYGWTIDEIFKLSLREISFLMEQSNIRGHNNLAFKAKLAGATGIEFIVKTPKVEDNPDVDNKVKALRQEAVDRLRERHGKRNHGKD